MMKMRRKMGMESDGPVPLDSHAECQVYSSQA